MSRAVAAAALLGGLLAAEVGVGIPGVFGLRSATPVAAPVVAPLSGPSESGVASALPEAATPADGQRLSRPEAVGAASSRAGSYSRTDLHSREREPDGEPQASAAIAFDLLLIPPARLRAAALVDVEAVDRRGPRAVTLWRLDPDGPGAAPLAHGASDRAGAVRFERLLLPPGDLLLAVAPRDADPRGTRASPPLRLPPTPVPPPPLTVRWDGPDHWAIEAALLAGATLVVSEADRLRPEPLATADGAATRVRLRVARPEGELRAAQALPDGRISAWAPVSPGPVLAPDLPTLSLEERP